MRGLGWILCRVPWDGRLLVFGIDFGLFWIFVGFVVGGVSLPCSCVRAFFCLLALLCGPSSLDLWLFWVLRTGGWNRLALVEDSFLV